MHQLSEEGAEADDCEEGEACSFRDWRLPSRHFHQVCWKGRGIACMESSKDFVPDHTPCDSTSTRTLLVRSARLALRILSITSTSMRTFTTSATNAVLPRCTQLWEQLIYDTEVKSRLLDYAEGALDFADRGVSRAIITWNRVVRPSSWPPIAVNQFQHEFPVAELFFYVTCHPNHDSRLSSVCPARQHLISAASRTHYLCALTACAGASAWATRCA